MDLSIFQMPPWLVISTITAIISVVYLYYSGDKRRKLGLPGPTPVPIFGHLIDIFKYGVCDFDLNVIKKHGKVAALNSGIFGNFLGDVLIADPDMLREVMVKQVSIFTDRNSDDSSQMKPIDKSVFSVRGEKWKQMRSTLTPTFSSGKLRHMEAMISKCANTLTDNLKKKAKDDETFDNKIWGNFTMDVIGATAFGIEIDSVNNPDHPFVKNAQDVNNISLTNPFTLLIIFLPGLVKRFEGLLRCIPGFRGTLGPFLYFGEITKNLLKERKESQEGHYNDFLQLMLNAHNMSSTGLTTSDEKEVEKWKKKALTTEEIAGNGMVFFIAGYGTTNDTLGFTAYLLATHPDVQERVVQEIDDILQGEEPTYDNVTKLPYLEQVINESMRLYPVGIRVDRKANQDTTVNGLFIPKGTAVAISIYAIHLDPDNYPNPEKFDPERFTAEAKAKRHPFTYLPFGMGPRNCIGMRLALLEMKMVLVKVLQNVTLKTCAETQVPLVLSKSAPVKPEKDIILKVELRSS